MIMGFLNREFVEVGKWKNWMNGCVMEIYGNSFVLSMFYMFNFMGELNRMRMVWSGWIIRLFVFCFMIFWYWGMVIILLILWGCGWWEF